MFTQILKWFSAPVLAIALLLANWAAWIVPDAISHEAEHSDAGSETLFQKAVMHQNKGEYKQAIKIYRQLAAQGYPKAYFKMGVFYSNGFGIKQDFEKSREWYLKAAARKNCKAFNNLGAMHQTGRGVAKNYKKAFDWYLMAASGECGMGRSQFFVGVYYHLGLGVEQDDLKARMWLRRAADQGYGPAQKFLDQLNNPKKSVRGFGGIPLVDKPEEPIDIIGTFGNTENIDEQQVFSFK